MADTKEIRTQLRIPADLYARVTEAAKESGRSMNAEMVRRLDGSFPRDIENEMLRQRMTELANLQQSLTEVRMAIDVEEARLRRADPASPEYRAAGESISVLQNRAETLWYLVDSAQADVTRLLKARPPANSGERPGPGSL